jgi:hypothetical protein
MYLLIFLKRVVSACKVWRIVIFYHDWRLQGKKSLAFAGFPVSLYSPGSPVLQPFPPLQAAFGHATIPQFVIPMPNQSAIFVGFFLAALISSLI